MERRARRGIDSIVLLTGDDDLAARRFAEKVPITDYRLALLPAQKLAAAEALRASYGALAMVGDGVNDAPGARGC